MLEHALEGLSIVLLHHSRAQIALQDAGGTAAFLHHLRTLKCQDPSESLLRVTWESIVNYLPIFDYLKMRSNRNTVERENKFCLYFCLTRESLIPFSYKMRILQAVDPQDIANSDAHVFITGIMDGLLGMFSSKNMGQKAEAAKYVSDCWKKGHLCPKLAETLELILDHLLRCVIVSRSQRFLYSEHSTPAHQISTPLPALMWRQHKQFSIRCWSYLNRTSVMAGWQGELSLQAKWSFSPVESLRSSRNAAIPENWSVQWKWQPSCISTTLRQRKCLSWLLLLQWLFRECIHSHTLDKV